jgi:hypothetical protein
MIHILASRAGRSLQRVLLAAVLALSVGSCDTDELVMVEDPEALRPEDLGGLAAVPALVNGAFRQFVGAYDGFGLDDGYLASSAAVSDEAYWGDTFTTRQAYDQRNFQPASLGNISDPTYTRMHQARFNARRAFAVVDEFTTPLTAVADSATKAQLRTIEGYVYVTLSEGFCGAVPFSKVADAGPIDPFSIEYGTPLGTKAMNDTAVARFNEALALNPANRLAAVGKGRALLNIGSYAAAAAAVQAVPTSFVFRLEHSQNTSGENNPIASLQSNGRWGVSNLEGGVTAAGAAVRPDENPPSATATSAEGLPFRSLSDPRVPWQGRPTSNNVCFSAQARCWLNNNYPTFDSDVPFASGVEARLIEAEADLQAGNGAAMITKLNALRASVASLLTTLYPDQRQVFGPPAVLLPLDDPVTPEARRALLFQERALWLYNTGHRQGDLRRLVRNYGLPSNQVFPSGPYFRSGTYGNDVAFPVPFTEENNPNFSRAACVTTQA